MRFGWKENCVLICPDGIFLNGKELKTGAGFPKEQECFVGFDVEVKGDSMMVQFTVDGKKNGPVIEFAAREGVYFRGLLRGQGSYISVN